MMGGHTDMTPDAHAIVDKMAEEIGERPHVMELLADLKPEMVAEQARSKQFANASDMIPEKYRQLILVAASAATGSRSCVKTQVQLALRKGASAREIADTLVLARFAVSSTVFSNAVDALELLAEARDERL